MALFFDFPVQSSETYSPIASQWHSQAPLLAVACRQERQGEDCGAVNLYTEDGERVKGSTVQRSAFPTVIAWHPTAKILATGWDNGEIIVWNEKGKTAHECKRLHNGPVRVLAWSDDGSQLASGGDSGRFGLWNGQSDGSLSLVTEQKMDGAITHGVMCTSSDSMTRGQSFTLFSTANGDVFKFDDSGHCEKAFSADAQLHALLLEPTATGSGGRQLVAITGNLMMHAYSLDEKCDLEHSRSARLNGKEALCITWGEPGVLIGATRENCVRIWDLVNDEFYLLSLAKEKGPFSKSDVIKSVTYDRHSELIAGVSRNGFVYMWRMVTSAEGRKLECEDKWKFMSPPTELGGELDATSWGLAQGRSVLAAQGEDGVSVLSEHMMRKSFGAGTAAVQVSSGRIVVETHKKKAHDLDTDFPVKGVCASGEYVAVRGADAVAIHELVKDFSILRSAGNVKCKATAIAIHKQMLFTAEGRQVHCRDMSGTSTQALSLNESEGKITHLSANGDFLVGATSTGIIRLWDLSRREPKPYGMPKQVEEKLGAVADVQVNATGSRVSYVGTSKFGASSLWVWNVEANESQSFDFGEEGKQLVSHFWDTADERLLVCHTETTKGGASVGDVSAMFATPDDGIQRQYSFDLTPSDGPLLGVSIPHLFLAKRPGSDTSESKIIDARPLRDFVGMEDADPEMAKAMMNFSYHLTLGNMDEAFKSVRQIKSDAVWVNMARMCVSTRRLDVAQVCLGNIGNAIGARALREASSEPQPEAQMAVLAIHMEMYPEAEELYKSCGRFDLLNKLYQAQGKWKEAMDTAKDKDRVHLRNTYYAYAKYLESAGELPKAAEFFELSQTHKFEIPRMYSHDPTTLEGHVKRSQKKELLKWWGKYMESSSQLSEAIKFYSAADDIHSLVRVHCYLGNLDKAKDLVDKTGNKAAAYHIARQYESQDQIQEAIKYFSKSEMYNNAIRLAKEYGLKQEMLSLALRSTKADMIEAAQYYEQQPGMVDKAVTLYHKGGRVGKALELCFQHNLYQALAEISDDLDSEADPELIDRAANFFIENNQMDKAAGLLLVAKKYDEAIDMCVQHNVVISEDMAEKFTLPKGEGSSSYRKKLLEKVADCCAAQGSYQLATKKYTQAGNRVKAMRALLKCGDTEKIIYFAGKCRDKEIYVMAANYLQSLDWRRDQEVMKNIIQFYTKGKALDSLANFYDACAQVEIDDYQNYDKALGALHEALKCMSKAKMKDFDEQEARVSSLQQRIIFVKKFTNIRSLAESDPAEMLQQAKLLLQEPDVETAIRIGDVYGLMIEYLASKEEHQKAYNLMQEMRQKIARVNIAYYVNMRTIENVHRALDIPLGRGFGAEDEGDEEIPEDDV